jgi:hypothetical protein
VSIWAVGLDGRGAHQLATGPGWQWRAAPGRTPGEVLYVRTDMQAEARSEVIAIDSATGAEREHFAVVASSAAVADGAVYFAVLGGSEIRRRRAGHEESWLTLPSDLAAQQIVTSPVGGLIAFTTDTQSAPVHLCVATQGATPKCIGRHASGARPEFSRDGAGLWFGDVDGVSRHDLASDKDELVLPGAHARGGVSIAPDGKRLVYSECSEQRQLVDVTKPDAAIIDDDNPDVPVFGPNGELAWVHEAHGGGDRLLVRRTDGTIVELVPPTFGRISELAFDATGDRIAFVAGGDHPGIHVAVARQSSGDRSVTQLTDGANDYAPHFTSDGHVLFTRIDDRNVSHIYSVPSYGGAVVLTSPASRAILAMNPADGELLISSGTKVIWWDPITDKTRTPRGAFDEDVFRRIAISPHGRWMLVQSGAAGLTFWRSRMTDPLSFELVRSLPADWSVESSAIDDDGRVFAPVSRWNGELRIVDAAPGVTL